MRSKVGVGIVTLIALVAIGIGVTPSASAALSSPLTRLFVDRVGADPLTLSNAEAGSIDNWPPGTVILIFDGPSHFWDLIFMPPSGDEQLAVGPYEDTHRGPSAGSAGLDVEGDGGGCENTSGRFDVDDIAYNADGTVSRASIRFEQHCDDTGGAIFGEVSYKSTAAFRARTVPNQVGLQATRVGHTSAPTQITLTNNGPSPLTVSSPSISGPNASDFNISASTCGNALANDQSCALSVTFSPAPGAVGPRTAVLTFFDEIASANGTGRDIQLTGWNDGSPGWSQIPFLSASSDPVAFADDTRVYAVALDEYYNLHGENRFRSGWNDGPIVTTTGGFYSAPTGIAVGANIDLFATDSTGAVLDYYSGAGSASLGGVIISTPEAAADSTGVYIFGVGTDRALWYRHRSGSVWSPWNSLGGYLNSDLSATSVGADTYVFGRGGDGALWYQHLASGVPSGWIGLGGVVTSFPSAVADSSGVHVFVRGSDNALWDRRVSGAPSTWKPLGGYLLSAPEAVSDASGLYVFALGGDHAMWFRRLTVAPTNWSSLGGYLVSNPAAAADPGGAGPLVVAVGTDDRLWARTL